MRDREWEQNIYCELVIMRDRESFCDNETEGGKRVRLIDSELLWWDIEEESNSDW